MTNINKYPFIHTHQVTVHPCDGFKMSYNTFKFTQNISTKNGKKANNNKRKTSKCTSKYTIKNTLHLLTKSRKIERCLTIALVQLHLAFFFSFFAHVCSQHLIGLKPGPDKLESMDDDDKLVLLLGPEALSNFKRPRKLHFLLHPSMP